MIRKFSGSYYAFKSARRRMAEFALQKAESGLSAFDKALRLFRIADVLEAKHHRFCLRVAISSTNIHNNYRMVNLSSLRPE